KIIKFLELERKETSIKIQKDDDDNEDDYDDDGGGDGGGGSRDGDDGDIFVCVM
ncbi:hypothetical protein PanWU01x14_227070, partial [Parasponia andersonii]